MPGCCKVSWLYCFIVLKIYRKFESGSLTHSAGSVQALERQTVHISDDPPNRWGQVQVALLCWKSVSLVRMIVYLL